MRKAFKKFKLKREAKQVQKHIANLEWTSFTNKNNKKFNHKKLKDNLAKLRSEKEHLDNEIKQLPKFNPLLAYIPVYGYVYAVLNIDELFERKYHFITSSLVNAYTSILTFGLIALGVEVLTKFI